MDDIVKLLRELMWHGTFPEQSVYGQAVLGAADEIERLRALLAEHGRHSADCKFGFCWCKELEETHRD